MQFRVKPQFAHISSLDFPGVATVDFQNPRQRDLKILVAMGSPYFEEIPPENAPVATAPAPMAAAPTPKRPKKAAKTK